ncbi:translation initiation factor IF-2 [Candidatus Sulcia muelleri SMDSEM]|uniref:Translation initiation factor IF-2 n=1 Tax=Karelsulcia muelleri (strain SMDSEM) TaxID=595499 RepID=C7LKE5_KARMS|nr:translation initiation factor IF-2 [Candidatus Karelsulcia muelleri SMDSEM]
MNKKTKKTTDWMKMNCKAAAYKSKKYAKKDGGENEKDLKPRSPVVTIMGHVDHGKTSLLDYIRKTNIIAGEFGGITQHVGAYNVKFKNGKSITFLDTPGHEAFTAMRARGTKITDIVIIVIATDENVMPQTKEAISHAQVAKVPIIFALNKIDKVNSDPMKIKRKLSEMNFLLKEWGGNYPSQEISAKSGEGVDQLLEKILLEAKKLNLRANPNKPAEGTVIEASLEKERGYTTTILIQGGTLKVGDYLVAGTFHGKVKLILNERGKSLKKEYPSKPVIILGLNGPPFPGEKFKVFLNEKEAKQFVENKIKLKKEQKFRFKRKPQITLEQMTKKIKKLKLIIKADVDGSVEALSDSLENLSTDKIVVQIIYKNIGLISESDILLAVASNAIIIGFNVKITSKAKILANQKKIEIRLYSVIYNAINAIKKALDVMTAQKINTKLVGTAKVINCFKHKKIGTIAGCLILTGQIKRNSKLRLIRKGQLIYSGELNSLKRFKEDVKEVNKGYECGIVIKNFNDIQIGDIIEFIN